MLVINWYLSAEENAMRKGKIKKIISKYFKRNGNGDQPGGV